MIAKGSAAKAVWRLFLMGGDMCVEMEWNGLAGSMVLYDIR